MADVSHQECFTVYGLRLEEVVRHVSDPSLEFCWEGLFGLLHCMWKVLDHEAQIWKFLSYLNTNMSSGASDLVLLLVSYIICHVPRIDA